MTLEKSQPEILEGKKPLPPPIDMKVLIEKVKTMPEEKIREKLSSLNRYIQSGGQTHEIEVIADPKADTWACARAPKKQVQNDGKIVETNFFKYFIILPHHHLAIDDNNFILGELKHELGHAFFTDWRMDKRLTDWIKAQGYQEHALSQTLNTLEDPRMEHVSVYPLKQNGYIRDFFWQKNKMLILKNIGDGIGKMDPVSQFDFLIKLYSLWQLHKENAEKENIETWDSYNALNPDVLKAWKKVKSSIDQIVGVGSAKIPEMRSVMLEKSIKEIIWPAKKELIDKYGLKEPEKGESYPSPSNPDDFSNLPPDLQNLIKQKIENYNKNIDDESKKKIEFKKAIDSENKKIDAEKNKNLEKIDGMQGTEVRKKFNDLKREASVITRGMSKIFERYFPKISFPKDTYGIRGKRYDHREHLKRFGTGMEKPMATPNIPEKAGFILQIIIDKSESMSNKRIEQVVKSVIGILEAAEDYPIYIEVLASDNLNGGSEGVDTDKYILKAFDEEYGGASGGKIKSKLVNILDECKGGNEDDESLKWAVPRVIKKKRELMSQYEKLSTLVIFFSDAEEEGQQDPNTVNDLRKKVPILGGAVDPTDKIKQAIQRAYGQFGEGSFCPDALAGLPKEIERAIRKKVGMMFR